MSNLGCATCESRNKKCDRTKGPNGCRRCAKAGIECSGYLATKTSKSARGIRNNEPQTKLADGSITHHGSYPPDLATNASTELVPDTDPSRAAELGDYPSSALAVRSDFSAAIPTPQQYTDRYSHTTSLHKQVPTPPIERVAKSRVEQVPIFLAIDGNASIEQMPTPPIEGVPLLPRADGSMNTGTILVNSISSLVDESPALPWKPRSWKPRSPGPSVYEHATGSEEMSSFQLQATDWPVYSDDEDDIDPEDPENLQVELLKGLVLDRGVESNMVSFMVHSFTSWMSRFLFEPTRVIPLFRESIARSQSYGEEAHQRMVLIANAVLNVSESTDYDLTPFTILYSESVKGVMEARSRGNLTMEMAVAAMQSCHEIIAIMCKVCSLASVLNTMELYAPVFRRACPESSTELVNLPRILTSFDVHLKLYATMDVLLSAVTYRPMFFRYNLEFPSAWAEQILNSDDGPGLRWLAGVPDRLMITLARMNTLLEDYGHHVDLERVTILENEINACTTAFSSGSGTDPALALGRIVVQESWRLVALIYLYMGLCGADSTDARVVNAQKKFMRLLLGIKPRRNPDTFLVVPMMILGIATSSPQDQAVILARLWGISECKKPETFGNDMIRILTDLWGRTTERPTVWSDVRSACTRITGM